MRRIFRNLAPAHVEADDSARVGAARRLARRLRDQRGFMLMELIMTMAILSLVVGGITGMLVSATKHQASLDLEFQAQESARLALSELRSDLHCATSVSPSSGSAASSITLTLPTGCRSGSQTEACSVVWSTVASTPPYTPPYTLQRVATPASCAHSGTWHLASGVFFRDPTSGTVSPNIFTPDAIVHGITCGSGGSTCSVNEPAGSTVILTATGDNGASVTWSGNCLGTSPTCSLSMSSTKNVTATFSAGTGTVGPGTPPPTVAGQNPLAVTVRGNGTVTGGAVLPDVAVNFAVAAGNRPAYQLADTIYLRNGARQ